MVKGRSLAAWAHTSSILAILAEVNRDHKKRPAAYKPSDFNPHEQRRSEASLPKLKMKDLKNMILGGMKTR